MKFMNIFITSWMNIAELTQQFDNIFGNFIIR